MKILNDFLEQPVRLAQLATSAFTFLVGWSLSLFFLPWWLTLVLYPLLLAGYILPWLWLLRWLKLLDNRLVVERIWLVCQMAWVGPLVYAMNKWFVWMGDAENAWWGIVITILTLLGLSVGVVNSFMGQERD